MKKLNQYLLQESRHQMAFRQQEIDKLNAASKYLYLNVAIYILITIVEYWLASIGHSQALKADALNNLSGVISTGVLILGIREATNVNDDDILGRDLPKENVRSQNSLQMSRFRLETIFTLVTSFIIILIALQIIVSGIIDLKNIGESPNPNLISALGAGIATVMMLVVFFINRRFGKKLKNTSLLAASKDSLGDVVTSFGTMLTVLISYFFQLTWIDSTVSILIGIFILWQGLVIFQECTLNLIDYVDPALEKKMRQTVSHIKGVHKIMDLTSRYNGNMLVVDIFILVNPKATAVEIYDLNEKIERKLHKKYNVYDVTVTIIPDM